MTTILLAACSQVYDVSQSAGSGRHLGSGRNRPMADGWKRHAQSYLGLDGSKEADRAGPRSGLEKFREPKDDTSSRLIVLSCLYWTIFVAVFSAMAIRSDWLPLRLGGAAVAVGGLLILVPRITRLVRRAGSRPET
jgi:hypothetical protein